VGRGSGEETAAKKGHIALQRAMTKKRSSVFWWKNRWHFSCRPGLHQPSDATDRACARSVSGEKAAPRSNLFL